MGPDDQRNARAVRVENAPEDTEPQRSSLDDGREPGLGTRAAEPVSEGPLYAGVQTDVAWRSGGLPREFPNTDTDARLVLYETEVSGFAVRWQADERLVSLARDAFYEAGAAPELRLVQSAPSGRVAACSRLADSALDAVGYARFESPVTGALHAELGLASEDGGWLLLARSNRLESVGDEPGAMSLPEYSPDDRSGDQAASCQAVSSSTPAAEASPSVASDVPSDRSLLPVDEAAPIAVSEFPIATPAPLPSAAATTRPFETGASATAGFGPAAPARDHAALSQRPGPDRAGQPLAGPDRESWSPQARGAGDDFNEHAQREILGGPTTPDISLARPEPASWPGLRAGSGPIASHRGASRISIRGELRVNGDAPPASWLDLGGHPYRVGPGGRFAFSVALDDLDLLLALLSRLPRLPVDDRDSDGEDA